MNAPASRQCLPSKSLLILVDDHSVVRAGVEQALEEEFRILSCGNAGDARKMLKQHSPDLLIVDLSLPDGDGLTLIGDIKKELDQPPAIVAFSRHGDPGTIQRALALGASAYINKRSSLATLRDGIHHVLGGQAYLDETSQRTLKEAATRENTLNLEALTRREIEIFQAMGDGLCANGLAKRFQISTNTVGNHRRNILKKINAKTLTELYYLASRKPPTH